MIDLKETKGKMEKQFIPIGLALRMKKIGFKDPCILFFCQELGTSVLLGLDERSVQINIEEDKDFLIPTFSQCFSWFRREYDIEFSPMTVIQGATKWYNISGIVPNEITGYSISNHYERYDIYEEAELACLEKLLEIVESKSE